MAVTSSDYSGTFVNRELAREEDSLECDPGDEVLIQKSDYGLSIVHQVHPLNYGRQRVNVLE